MMDGSPNLQEALATARHAQRRYERERASRLAAEDIAERSLRDLYAKTEQLELVRSIATAANESETLEAALQFALNRICATTDFPLGHAYVLDHLEEGAELAPSELWSGLDETTLPFKAVTLQYRFARNMGLPGRILATARPAWIPDLSLDGNFPRAGAAAASSLRSAFAFPVLIGAEVVAVLEFFSRIITQPDEHLLDVVTQVGTQLGRVAERKRTEMRLLHEASHDHLTRLPNRALFLDCLTRAVARQKRDGTARFAVLFVDLDRFKLINDSLGHSVGDELIVQVAHRLSACIRTADLVARTVSYNTNMLARLGGDEFTIFLENLQSLSDALQVADRIQQALTPHFLLGVQEVYITASVGIAWSGDGELSPHEILRDADMAMYRAKQEGKARYAVYDESMFAAAVDRLRLEAQLREALDQQEFVLHFQPIVCLASSEIAGFEALVRWQPPGMPLVFPDRFITVAEESGLIVRLGTWVLREACSTLVRWNATHLHRPPLHISVNVSGKQFCEPDFIQTVQGVLDSTGLDPNFLKLELTESVTMGDADRAITLLRDLCAMGVRISIDDFGTGYSSLSYLHRLPLQTLKIDKSFVLRMGKDSESLAVIRTILALAHSLGMDVVAEGAETMDHCGELASLNCEFAQGYFYSRPVPAAAAEMLLHSGFASKGAAIKQLPACA